MLDDLFIKSVKKPVLDVSSVINRKFSDKGSKRFKPQNGKKVQLYNAEVIKSKKDNTLKFTNHYSKNTNTLVLKRLDELSNNIEMITEHSPEEVNFNNRRLKQIFQLYLDDFSIEELEDDRICKVRLEDSLGMQNGVRVYFLINNAFDAYEIILIDLFHLVIPSNHKRKSKVEMLKKTFEENINNDLCISDFFNIKT